MERLDKILTHLDDITAVQEYSIIVYDFLNKPYSRTGSFILIK